MIVEVTSADKQQASADGYGESEDYDRSKKERDFDGWVGDLGEAVLERVLENKTPFDFEYRGGKTEPDFVVEGVTIDVKTRTVIDDEKRDLIVPADINDYPHDIYILLRCVYAGEDWEEKERHEREVEALELIGIWKGEEVVERAEPFNPPWVQGRASANKRDTVICEFDSRTSGDWMDFGPLLTSSP